MTADGKKHCRCAQEMELVWVWDDAQATDHAFNVFGCPSCGTLLKEDVWVGRGQLWIDLDGKVERVTAEVKP